MLTDCFALKMSKSILENVQKLEEALKCEVCKNLLNDPIIVIKCGHSTCRLCFERNSDLHCPVCEVPVNTMESFEDKPLKELLVQLEYLKSLLSNDPASKGSPDEVLNNEVLSRNITVETNKESDEKENRNVEVAENVKSNKSVCAAESFVSSTPRVKRKAKILPRTKTNRPSNEDDSVIQATQERSRKSISSSFKRRSFPSTRSEENQRNKSGSSLNSSMLNKKNHKGETLLHRAVIKGDTEKVKELIKQGASVNTQDNNGWTPLHEASNHGFFEIAKLLLDNGALVNVPSQKDNITPLHDALINDQVQIAILLASRGADLHAKTAMGYTAVDLCKNDDDKASLVQSCSPFICPNISASNKKKNGGKNEPMILLPTGLSELQRQNLERCALIIKAEIVDTFGPEVTHIVASCDKNGNCTRTMKVLFGILSGKWIINYQWIDVCLEYKLKVDEEVFEVQGTKNQPNTQGPKTARRNMEQKYPPLLDGFYFYLHGSFCKPMPEREDICNLIRMGGGKVLSREPREDTVAIENYRLPFHAPGTPVEGVSHIILYQDKPPRGHHFRCGHICTTHVMWLIECICEFKLKELKKSD